MFLFIKLFIDIDIYIKKVHKEMTQPHWIGQARYCTPCVLQEIMQRDTRHQDYNKLQHNRFMLTRLEVLYTLLQELVNILFHFCFNFCHVRTVYKVGPKQRM